MALEKIGPYDFLGTVGRGGMGSVYRGQHRETGEIHAIKVLAPSFADEDHFRNRFESEIRSLIKLDHPNIVRILSYGQEAGNLYFAMELVVGNSLFQIQKKGHRFDWREILSIAKDVATGLRHAHDRGIIHRDLKPGNLLVPINAEGQRGSVKITDFGIAKRYGTSQNTGENILGTMDFMSPEQAKGQPVTARSDLYSLGTLLYTLLSGRPPFSANSVEESLRNLTRVPAPNIKSLVPDVPDEIDRLIERLMAKQPEQRIPTAQALLYKIEETEVLLLESSQAKTSESRKPKKENETFDLYPPGDVSTQVSTGRHEKSASKEPAPRAAKPTVEFTDASVDDRVASSSGRKIDYYNPVTEQIRKRQLDLTNEPTPHRQGMMPIALALLAVIGLAGFGIYYVNLPPSVEKLFSTIEANEAKPYLAVDEMELFLQHYPDDPRANQVRQLHGIGRAIQFYNRLVNKLGVRSNIPGNHHLTEIEKQFLEIVELSQDEKEMAAAKMAAFVMVHRNDDPLNDRDQKCIDAAMSYRIKLQNDARAEAIWKLQKIRGAMSAAEAASEPGLAIAVYKSILELYEDIDWGSSPEGQEGRELVQKAIARLAELQRQLADESSGDESSGDESSGDESSGDDQSN